MCRTMVFRNETLRNIVIDGKVVVVFGFLIRKKQQAYIDKAIPNI